MSQIELKKSRQHMPDNWPISFFPEQTFFGPNSAPYPDTPIVIITQEELESIRLVDYFGINQKEVAKLLNQSEESLDNILKSGRKKIASAILYDGIVRIEGTSSLFQHIDEND